MVDTEEEIYFDELTIPGEYSDHDILEGKRENISNNDEVWVKTKEEIWGWRVMIIPYSKKKRTANI